MKYLNEKPYSFLAARCMKDGRTKQMSQTVTTIGEKDSGIKTEVVYICNFSKWLSFCAEVWWDISATPSGNYAVVGH